MSHMHICMDKHTRLVGRSETCFPKKCRKFKCSGIVSEVVLGQKLSVVATRPADYSIQFLFGCILFMYGYLLSQITSNLHERGNWQNSRWVTEGGTLYANNSVCRKSIKLIGQKQTRLPYYICFHVFSICEEHMTPGSSVRGDSLERQHMH